jgi:hypothetical protein
MKAALLAVTLLVFLVSATHEVQAQMYAPYGAYPYGGYWGGGNQYRDYALQADPYDQLHVLHYQLYLQPYQSYPYQIYQPCCFVGGVIVPGSVAVVRPRPRVFFNPPVMRGR